MPEATFVHDGDAIDYTPSADTASGEVVVQESLVGVAKTPIGADRLGALAVRGVFDVVKDPATEFSAGQTVYWDAAQRLATVHSERDGLASYDYDDAGQLTDAAYNYYPSTQLDEHYVYDPNGNRLSAEYMANNPPVYFSYWNANTGSGVIVEDQTANNIDLQFVGDISWDNTDMPPAARVPDNLHVLDFGGYYDYLAADVVASTFLEIGTGDRRGHSIFRHVEWNCR